MKSKILKIIIPVAVVALLAFSFWYGGNSPSLRGWAVVTQENETSGAETTIYKETTGTSAATDTTETTRTVETTSTAETKDTTAEIIETTAKPADTMPTTTAPDADTEAAVTDIFNADTDDKPLPVEPENAVISDEVYTCTISISCASINDNPDLLPADKTELVPADGWLLEPTEVTFYGGESVFNVLLRTCKQKKLHMEYTSPPLYNSAYIEGIGNLYEFDCGELSGWVYSVDGWFPNYGCSRYALSDGAVIRFMYTCDLGADVGGHN